MFGYDHGTLADMVWEEYLKVVKENFHLRAQLATAERVVKSFPAPNNDDGPADDGDYDDDDRD